MSTEIKVGDRRIFRSASAREIKIIEQLTEDPFAGEFRYRYTDDLGGTGILPAENLEMSSRPAPPADAPQDHGPLAAPLSDRTLAKVLSRPAYVPSLVVLDAAEHLAAVATTVLATMGAEAKHAPLSALGQALADYRAAVTS